MVDETPADVELNRSMGAWFLTQAATAEGAARAHALDQLWRHYEPGLRSWLRHRYGSRLQDAKIDDILQEFAAEKVLRRDLFAAVRLQRGSVRAFLRTALRNFTNDQSRRAAALKEAPNQAGGFADVDSVPGGPSDSDDFDLIDLTHAWKVLTETIERFREQCTAENRSDLWQLFEAQVLRPAAVGDLAGNQAELGGRIGTRDTDQFNNRMVTIQRKLHRIVRLVLAQYVPADRLESEIQELHRVLRAAGGWNQVLVTMAAHAATGDPEMSAMVSSYSMAELSELLRLSEADRDEADSAWSAQVMSTLLAMQLPELGIDVPTSQGGNKHDLRQTLTQGSPARDVLEAIKSLAKSQTLAAGSPIPPDVWRVVYYASIAAAIRTNQSISALSADVLQAGLVWCLDLHWLDRDLRSLMQDARRRVDAAVA